jgi:hypothetical protein
VTDLSLAQLAEVRLRYAEYRAMPTPDGWHGVEVEGVDLVLLDTDVTECVETWLDNGGALDEVRWNRLTRRLDDLDRVLPHLTRESDVVYYTACRMLALLVWEADDLTAASPTTI